MRLSHMNLTLSILLLSIHIGCATETDRHEVESIIKTVLIPEFWIHEDALSEAGVKMNPDGTKTIVPKGSKIKQILYGDLACRYMKNDKSVVLFRNSISDNVFAYNVSSNRLTRASIEVWDGAGNDSNTYNIVTNDFKYHKKDYSSHLNKVIYQKDGREFTFWGDDMLNISVAPDGSYLAILSLESQMPPLSASELEKTRFYFGNIYVTIYNLRDSSILLNNIKLEFTYKGGVKKPNVFWTRDSRFLIVTTNDDIDIKLIDVFKLKN